MLGNNSWPKMRQDGRRGKNRKQWIGKAYVIDILPYKDIETRASSSLYCII